MKESSGSSKQSNNKVREARLILELLGFEQRQRNEIAALVLLSFLNLKPNQMWSRASRPLLGITPIIEFIRETYKIEYAPNTRETIRDEAVKHFVEAGMVVRNPDDPARPTNSGRTVYQIESSAFHLLCAFGGDEWERRLADYLKARKDVRKELKRVRTLSRIPVLLPSGQEISLSPGGQNPLIKLVVEEFCSRFTPGATIVYVGDAEDKVIHLDRKYLSKLGVLIDRAAKMPDVVAHHTRENWLVLIEAVTSAGPVDGKRRKELKELFCGALAGLVFVTAFESRNALRSFLGQISWETEVWVADDPDHLIHFDGERFLGPYPDVQPNP